MNITQIRYVLAVAASSSIREAAARLFVSQPAVSTSIKELEEELGLLIFERTNKGISLTDEGREFVTYAKKAVSQYEILEDRYLSRDGDKERFSVSAQHYNFAIRAFTAVIKDREPKKFVFSLHETRTMEVISHVGTMKSEVGIISFSSGNEDVIRKLFKQYELEFTPLMKRDTYAYVWENHPLAHRKEVSLSELSDYPCVAFDQGENSDFYITEEAMGDYDFQKLIKSDDRATTLEIIAELNGYSIGCGMLSEENAILKGLVSIKLVEEDPLVIGYITRRGSLLSEYGRAYLQELNKYRDREI